MTLAPIGTATVSMWIGSRHPQRMPRRLSPATAWWDRSGRSSDWTQHERIAATELETLPRATHMKQSLAHVALVVRDYDEAIAYFTGILDFVVLEDTYIPEQAKRWVLVAPTGSTGTSIVLARPSAPGQEAFIGNQTGGRVTFFLRTDDFWRDYNRLISRGVIFVRTPMAAPYGTVAVFKDLYGNLWDLVGPRVDGAQ
jgi:catechol 2,3-dioxygenase-like lactoylglutathione lyase family enzyme